MKLYGSFSSPFVQRVLIGARLKGHDLAIEPPLGGGTATPEFEAISPMGRIPLLELDDGRHICESSAILGYLDEVLPGPALLPDDPAERAHARQIVALAEGELAGGMRPMIVCRVFRRVDSADLVTHATAQIEKGLNAIERVRSADDAFAAGSAPGIADCTLLPFLTLMRLVDPMTGSGAMVAARPGLDAYAARAAAHPVLGRTVAEMEAGFQTVMARIAAANQAA